MKKIAVIGGGVSGVTFALNIQDTANFTIYEREDALLLKLLKTGNGKANIYNRDIKTLAYNDRIFMDKYVRNMEKTLDEYFTSLGLLTFTDSEKRVYPFSRSAKGLREYLLNRLTASVRVNTNVNIIETKANGFNVNGEHYDYVVLATGSAAGLFKYDLTNNNDELLQSLDLVRSAFVPVIKTIEVVENLKVLHNSRIEATLSLWQDGNIIFKDRGEVLFKERGLSGIVSFIVSSYFEWAIKDKPKATYKVVLDLMPDHSLNEVRSIIKTKADYHKVFAPFMVKYLNTLKGDVLTNVKALSFTPIAGNYPENTQALSGGILTKDINDNFTHKRNERLILLGEVLDVDGMCGGYNLGFAIYSALVASNDLLYKLSK